MKKISTLILLSCLSVASCMAGNGASVAATNVFSGKLLQSIQDSWGGTTTYFYNDRSQLVSIVSSEGEWSETVTLDYTGGVIEGFEYDVTLSEPGEQICYIALGENGFASKVYQIVDLSSDPETETWAFEYNADGQLCKMTRSEGDNEVTTLTYTNGNITHVTNTSGEQAPSVPEGNGTADAPYNATQAKAVGVANGSSSYENVYVAGYVVSGEISSQYGSGTWEIANTPHDTENTFRLYATYDTNNNKFYDYNKVKIGDLIVCCGPIYNYTINNHSTPEMAKGYLVSIKSSTGDEGWSDAADINYANAIENKGGLMFFDETLYTDMDEMGVAFYAGLLGRPTRCLPTSLVELEGDERYTYTFGWNIDATGYPSGLTIVDGGYTDAYIFTWVDASGVSTVTTDATAYPVEYYTTTGIRVAAPVRGINIVRNSDGTTSKIAIR